MKKSVFVLLLILSLAACSFSGETNQSIAAKDSTFILPDCAQNSITNDILGDGRSILYINGNNKLALVEDGGRSNFPLLKFDMEKKTIDDLFEPPHCVIASGDSLFVDGRYYYFTNCSTDDIRTIYKLDTENGFVETIDEHHLKNASTHSDSPFIYFSRFDDEKIIWVETNLDSSKIMLHDMSSNSTQTIVSYPNVPASETDIGISSHLVDTYVYDSRIYALVLRIDTSNKHSYMFYEFDETGHELGSYDLGDFELLGNTSNYVPLCIQGNRNYIVIRYWSGANEVYKLDHNGHTVEKVVDKSAGFRVLMSGMEYNYSDNCTQYIFMIKDDDHANENILYALDTKTGQIISKPLVSDEKYPYIYSGILDENGSLLLSYVALNSDGYKNTKEKIYYYLTSETIEDIFSEAGVENSFR